MYVPFPPSRDSSSSCDTMSTEQNPPCRPSQTANPLQLGIFLCMRCASIHRKLGTHISKVKSLSMDGWSNEQVEVHTAPKATQHDQEGGC